MKLYEKLDSLEHYVETKLIAKEKNDYFKELKIIRENNGWTFKYLINDKWVAPLDFLDKRNIKIYKSWKTLINKIKTEFDNIKLIYNK